MTDPQA